MAAFGQVKFDQKLHAPVFNSSAHGRAKAAAREGSRGETFTVSTRDQCYKTFLSVNSDFSL